MDATVSIPETIAPLLMDDSGDLARMALESAALEALRAGRITERQLRKMPGLTRIQLDGFLKAHGVCQKYCS